MTRRTLAAALALGLLGPSGAAASQANPFLPGIRPLGMGNAFVAVVDDRNALYYNPAGLSRIEKTSLSGLGLQGGVDSQFFELIGFIRDNEERFADFDNIDQEFYDSLAPWDDSWVSADANAYADLTRPNWGFGVYTTGRAQFKIDRGVYEPRVYADVKDDIVGTLGGSLPLGLDHLTAGGSVKAIFRREFSRALTAREVEDFEPEEVLEQLDGAESGFGLDLGLLWHEPDSRFSAGAVVRDAFGFVDGEAIHSAIDLGTAWKLDGALGLNGIVVAADLRDTFDTDASFGKKIHLGAELGLPIVDLRTGFNQGYPTFGLGVSLPFFSLDYAFHGREMGDLVGTEGQYLHALEARLGY